MKHLPLLLLLSLALAACSAEATTGASESELVARVSLPQDAGPTSNADELHYRAPACWWDPAPQPMCTHVAGREPTCPTCCSGCVRFDWGKQYAFLRAGPSLHLENLADHVVLSISDVASDAIQDHEFVDVDPNRIGGGGQMIVVPKAYAVAPEVYVWFVHDNDIGSTVTDPTLLPKLVPNF